MKPLIFSDTSHDTPTDVFLYYLEEYPGIAFDTELIWEEHYNLNFEFLLTTLIFSDTSLDTPTDFFLYYLEECPGITFDTELTWVELLLTLLTFPHYSLSLCWLFWYFQTHPTTRLHTFSYTVGPRYNEQRLKARQNDSKIWGNKPRYNEAHYNEIPAITN